MVKGKPKQIERMMLEIALERHFADKKTMKRVGLSAFSAGFYAAADGDPKRKYPRSYKFEDVQRWRAGYEAYYAVEAEIVEHLLEMSDAEKAQP